MTHLDSSVLRSLGGLAAVWPLLLGLTACSGNESPASSEANTAGTVETREAASLDDAPLGLEEDEPGNITFDPVEIPPTDFSQAGEEAEPNGDEDTASPMSTATQSEGPSNLQFAARGQLTQRDTDYFSFTVEGEPQLYLIEAEGVGVDRMTLYDAAGPIRQGMEPVRGQGGRQTITNIHLAPGEYRISLEQFRGEDASDYTLRVVPLGPVDPTVEREPNDDPSVAERLEFGVVRRGLLYEDDDTDYYRFSLDAQDLVRLRLEVPPEITPFLELSNGFLTGYTQNRGAEAGVPVEYTGLLQPGDYTLRIQSREGVSSAPYALSLRRLNPFLPPLDLEPNDEMHQAARLGLDGLMEGRVGEFGDPDWFALPVTDPETDIRIAPVEGSSRPHLRTTGTPRVISPDGSSVRLDWNGADSVWTARLPSAGPFFLEIRGEGEYAARLELDPAPEPGPASPGALISDVVVRAPEHPLAFSAFQTRWQELPVPITVRNQGSVPRLVTLDAAATHPGWSLTIPAAAVELPPGAEKTVAATLAVAPDAPSGVPVQLFLRASDGDGRTAPTSFSSYAACAAEPLGSGGPWTVPDALLGGVNVAWSALGGRISQTPPNSADYVQPYLVDGLTPGDEAWYVTAQALPVEITVELAGSGPVPVAGVILNPESDLESEYLVRAFEIHLSPDGRSFTRVLAGEMSPARTPQPFPLDEPVDARFARLRVLSSWNPGDPNRGQVGLGELEVIAVPGFNPMVNADVNLAAPALGGYVARSTPVFARYDVAEMMLTEEVEEPYLDVDPLNPTEWVIGFHHNRAALIREIQWADGPDDAPESRFQAVQVSVSLVSPVGPWVPLGAWALDRSAGQPAPFVLDEPVWARFVRMVSTDAVGTSIRRWQVPETVRILEHTSGAGYRSILGEWGSHSPLGPFERLATGNGESPDSARTVSSNDRKSRAQMLEAGQRYVDGVERGVKVSWYRYEVPRGENRLRFHVRGMPSPDIAAALETEEGNPVPLEDVDTVDGRILEAAVQGGETYWLQVTEPLRHIVVTWDNSGSVRPFSPVIYRALSDFTRRLRPGTEFVKLLPFRTGGFLAPEWSDQTLPLARALQSYDRMDDDSDAETYLMAASQTLAAEEGVRAVIMIADAETFSYGVTADLWASLARVRPRVFTLELHRGPGAAHQQDLMQSWSTVNGGVYARFSRESDLDRAFDRAFCMLRRPVRYTIEAVSRYEEPPPPGTLTVELQEGVFASNAVELILDASGSMLQRIGGKRRIDIARDVLTELVGETLPEGVPLALRVFGHRTPDACDTDLEVPLRPLDRESVTEIIRCTEAMNLARTPIGESLRLVAEDLADAQGQRLVILITDGEETCEGDPAASIRFLKDEGLDVRVNIVGFAIDDEGLKGEFEEWSRLGGGLYFDVSSEEELGQALEQALRPKFRVLGPGGDVVAEGTVGGEAVTLPVGTYRVQVLSTPVRTFENVVVEPERQSNVEIRAGG